MMCVVYITINPCLIILYIFVHCRLGQACSHVAALLFFIEYHAGNEKLPTEFSRTSQPMKWNQQPKKEIAPARSQDMTFVKPAHCDTKKEDKIECISKSEFDPRHPMHRTLQEDRLTTLLCNLQRTLPGTELQQFWVQRSQDECESTAYTTLSIVWSHVIF